MATITLIVTFLGWGVMAIGTLWFLFRVFSKSILWGLLCLFTGVASLVALFKFWPDVKQPFYWQLAGIAIFLLGALLGSSGR